MLKNYIKTTLRYLWRNRLFTALNVLGLAIGISASWIIFRMVDFEFSYDKKEPDRERIFQLISRMKTEDGRDRGQAFVPTGVLPALLHDVSGLEKVAPLYARHYETAKTTQMEVNESPSGQLATLPEYFNMVGYTWLAGDQHHALDAPEKVVLTLSRAQKYFPGLSPAELLGKTVIYNDTLLKKVGGIVDDLDYLNSFSGQEFFTLEEGELTNTDWMSLSSDHLLFVKTKKGVSSSQVLEQINRLNAKINQALFDEYHARSWFEFLPLPEKHFAIQYGNSTRTASKPVLYGLMAIAAFLLTLACINYINLTTAQLPQRAKEIGIRKTMGSSHGRLIYSFLGETFLICLLAVLLSVLITVLFLKIFAEYIPEGMNVHKNDLGMFLFSLLLIVSITLLAGLYPSWLVTRVQIVRVLKGEVKYLIGGQQISLRKGLIVFQFVIAQVFVVCSIIIGQQLKYTLDKDLGFQHEAILTLDIPYKIRMDSAYRDKPFVLKQILSQHPEITRIALGDLPMSDWMNASLMDFNTDSGKITKQVMFKNIDADYLDVYQIPLLAGRDIQETDTVNELVINETALKAFGFHEPEEAVGQTLLQGTSPRRIVGVVKDFHEFNLKSGIDLLAFTSNKPQLATVNIKLAPANISSWDKSIALIEKEWKKVYPSVPFSYQFYDDAIRDLYQKERSTSKLIGAATIITLLISCLGLFGLATLTAFQRTKEIGIRKVLGATVSSIVSLLSKDFVKLVLIALLVASPIAWWAMNKWLEDFAYKIDIQWWMFGLAGLGAVVIALSTVSYQAIKTATANPVDSLRNE